jgi:hypothetical protein
MCALISVLQSVGGGGVGTDAAICSTRYSHVRTRRAVKSGETCTEGGYAEWKGLYGSNSLIYKLCCVLIIKRSLNSSAKQDYKNCLDWRV